MCSEACTAAKTLVLPVAAKWYWLIASGEKTVELRAASHHWEVRLLGCTHVAPQLGGSVKALSWAVWPCA